MTRPAIPCARIIRRASVHAVLGFTCCVTAFPFLWMAVSSLKTKEEVLDTASFLPSVPQFGNYRSILADSPIPGYLANSFFVSLAAAAIQLVCCALFTYAVTFMKIRNIHMTT